MNDSEVEFSIGRLILAPALISLAVTLLRLTGELNRWSPVFFNREAGGPGALIGIVWLVPVFGVYFALRLSRAGRGPVSRGRAIGFAAAGVVAFALLATAASMASTSIVLRIVLINIAAALSALVVYRGWPDLSRIQLLYGLSARIPVAVIMLLAMAGDWGTHYELGPPDFPPMSLIPKWVAIGLMPQLVFWIGFTVIVGSLFGSVALLFQRQNR